MTTLFIDLMIVPSDWRDQVKTLAENGMRWRWEAQPIADQIKLHDCENIPADLPNWFRCPKDEVGTSGVKKP